MADSFRSGYIALAGRPNVGKSTLVNGLVGHKVSIVSPRPQTTRHRTLGIKTDDQAQLIFVDAPGLHSARASAISRYMNRTARASLEGVDAILLVITAQGWQKGDELALKLVNKHTCPVILAINKIDELPVRDSLLPLIEASSQKMPFAEIVPVSAKTGVNIAELEQTLRRYLPQQPPLFPSEQVSDRDERFMAAELIREQIFYALGQEVPYACTVELQQYERESKLTRVEAVIWVEKDGQKGILIGKDGERLKTIGQRARVEMEQRWGGKVYLGLWVKVRTGWPNDEDALRRLGMY